ncbi:hypothetical protein LTR84_008764 [Exophiala bonariae]|uniref:Glycosyltransferase 2-like domain-containing protein n=1 Tax=Exophiala bonariae TaxID=1690606 RepID=A0AAV9MXI0_9EURO|nr:hypothetical protein LTR84_008764 [Exophiala bonariae]
MAAYQPESTLSLTAAGKKVIANAVPISTTMTEAVFEVDVLERVKPPPASKWGQYLAVISFANLLLFILGLWLNIFAAQAQGQGLRVLLVPFVFALSQIFEHSSAITEALWHYCIFLNKKIVACPVLRLRGNHVPPVVMIIVTCGEPLDIILDTIKAALDVDYPKDKLRLIVADDGNDVNLRNHVSQLQHSGNTHLSYTYRVVGKGYKAGNLNECLKKFVPALNFKFEWICVLDADMMPEPHILRALIPHTVNRDEVGMVTTGQHFYNIPANDPLYQSNITGPHAEDGARDSCGAAWCPGSGFIMRFKAWCDIGGFPEYAITEDLFTSWHLHGRGWKTMLVHEVLQWGLQPDCFVVHMKQRRRWWTGHISRAITTNLSLSDERLEGANFVQRYAMFQHCMRPFFNTVFKVISLVLIIVCVATGEKVLATPSKYHVLPIFLSLVIRSGISRYNEVKDLPDLDRVWNMRRRHATNTWLGLHFAVDTVKAVLPTLLKGKVHIKPLGFEVSGVEEKKQDSAHERNKDQRGWWFQRVILMHQKERILYHPLMAIAVTAIIIHQCLKLNMHSNNFWHDLTLSVGFPGLGLIELLPLEFTPVLYAMFPPSMPSRRELMTWVEKKEMWLPKAEAKKMVWTASTSVWLEIPHLIAFFWLMFVMYIQPWQLV